MMIYQDCTYDFFNINVGAPILAPQQEKTNNDSGIDYYFDPESNKICVIWENFTFPFVFTEQQYISKPGASDYSNFENQMHMRTSKLMKAFNLLTSGHSVQQLFKHHKHSRENFIGAYWLCIDVDEGTKQTMCEFINNADIKPTFAYESYSNSEAQPKYHLFYVFDRMMNEQEFLKCYDCIVNMLKIGNYDKKCRQVTQVINGTYGADKQRYFSGAIYKVDHFCKDAMPFVRQLYSYTNDFDNLPLFATYEDIISFYDYSDEWFGYVKCYQETHKDINVNKLEKGTPEYYDMVRWCIQKRTEAKFLRLSKLGRLIMLKHIPDEEFKKHLRRLDEDPQYNIGQFDPDFTKEEIEYYTSQLNIDSDVITSIQDELRLYGYVSYVNVHKKDFFITLRSMVKFDRIYGYGRTSDEHYELYVRYKKDSVTGKMIIDKRRDGEKRRKGCFTDVLTLLKINPKMQLDEIMFNMAFRVVHIYDNSDNVLTPHCLLRKAMDAMIKDNMGMNNVKPSKKSGKLIASAKYCLDTHVKPKAVIRTAFKIEHYKEIDAWYDPDLSPRENYIAAAALGFDVPSIQTLKRYAKYRNYKTAGKALSIMDLIFDWYNPRKSVKENLAYAKKHAIKVSQSTLYNFCKKYNIPTSGVRRLSQRIVNLFNSQERNKTKQQTPYSLTECFFNPQIKFSVNRFDGTDPYKTDIVSPNKRAEYLNWSEQHWQLYLNQAA